MKVCVISPSYPYGKIHRYYFVEQLCNTLADQGHDITVISPQSLTKSLIRQEEKVPYYHVFSTKLGCTVKIYQPTCITVGNMPIIGKAIYFKGYANAIKKVINKEKINPDVFYCHFWHTAYWTYTSIKKLNKPIFVASGEAEIDLHKVIPLKKLENFVNSIRGVICVSTKNKKESINAGLTKEEKCIIIPNAIDSKLFYYHDKKLARKKLGFSLEDFIVSFVGGFIYRKGSLRLSQAIDSLKDDYIKSIYIGGVQDGDRCEPTGKDIIFKGRLKHDEIPLYLACSDVFVLPTLHEGCSNAIVEALACGIPVISSDLDFNYDILNKNNSILIDPNNINEIAEAIKKLKEDKILSDRLSQGALETAKELTIDVRAKKIIQFIKSRI